MDCQKLRRTFNFDSLACYWIYRYLTNQISQDALFQLLDKNPKEDDDQVNRFEIIRWFHKINKSWFHKACIFIRGFFVGLRVKLFNVQCKIFESINEDIDLFVILGIFGIQFLLQTALAMVLLGRFSLLVFLGILLGQFIFTGFSMVAAGLYCAARELSDEWR